MRNKAIESADEDVVIDRVERLGQVNEYGCTILFLKISFRTLSVA